MSNTIHVTPDKLQEVVTQVATEAAMKVATEAVAKAFEVYADALASARTESSSEEAKAIGQKVVSDIVRQMKEFAIGVRTGKYPVKVQP